MDVSVVIPTFNRAAGLPALIERLLQQDAGGLRYEVLVVDNNSTDATPTVVQDLIARDTTGRLRYAREPRQGVSHARNTGVERTAAPLIFFLDDDGVPELTGSKENAFLAKYSASGQFVWARGVDAEFGSSGWGLAAGDAVYLTGNVSGDADFDGDGTADVDGAFRTVRPFVARYDTDGSFQWVRHIAGSGIHRAYAVEIGPGGSIYATGRIHGLAGPKGEEPEFDFNSDGL